MSSAGIHDVAKAAGVSISTVSRAFTRPGLVSDETRRKVLETADRLDFNISRSAAALKSGQTYRVALLMNEDISSWFNAEVFMGINSVLQPHGYDISLFQRIDSARHRRDFFTTLPVRRNVDAVFVASFAVDPHEVEQLKRVNVPLIGINSRSDCFDASIGIDDEKEMGTATNHLLNLGHRDIVYLCSDPIKTIDSSMDARKRGFVEACTAAAKRGDINWKVISIPRDSVVTDYALTHLLALPHFPDAICCQMDRIAVPLTLKLAKYGYRTPRDYSITGFDGTPESDLIGLTTMRQNPREIGRRAADKALALIEGKTLDDPNETARAQLILRDTDAVYPTDCSTDGSTPARQSASRNEPTPPHDPAQEGGDADAPGDERNRRRR